ncbi:MAG: SPOR domain-containing protein [Pseudomonadota bacterium]
MAWSWQLYNRDVGNIPVIRAELEPMRVAPEEPGGLVMPHQGLTVNEVIEGEGVQPVETELTLAPLPAVPLEEDLQPVAEAPVEVAAEERAEVATEAPLVEESVVEEVAVVASGSAFAPSSTIVPPQRPADLTAVDLRAPINPRTAETAALTPDDIAAGTPLVQLGAFNSTDIAVNQWGILLRDNEDILGPHRRFIEPVLSGGRRLYRLRVVGFGDLAEAQAACVALQARGLACIPTVMR